MLWITHRDAYSCQHGKCYSTHELKHPDLQELLNQDGLVSADGRAATHVDKVALETGLILPCSAPHPALLVSGLQQAWLLLLGSNQGLQQQM